MPRACVDAEKVFMSNGIVGSDLSIVNPFFDSKQLTDDQLLTKMSECNRKISAASMAGASMEVIDQLMALREMLGREFSERAVLKYGNNKGEDEFDGLIG